MVQRKGEGGRREEWLLLQPHAARIPYSQPSRLEREREKRVREKGSIMAMAAGRASQLPRAERRAPPSSAWPWITRTIDRAPLADATAGPATKWGSESRLRGCFLGRQWGWRFPFCAFEYMKIDTFFFTVDYEAQRPGDCGGDGTSCSWAIRERIRLIFTVLRWCLFAIVDVFPGSLAYAGTRCSESRSTAGWSFEPFPSRNL